MLLTDSSPYGPREITAAPSEVEGARVYSRRGWVRVAVGQPWHQELLLEELVSGGLAAVSLTRQPTGNLILVNSRIPAKGNRALEADLFSHRALLARERGKSSVFPGLTSEPRLRAHSSVCQATDFVFFLLEAENSHDQPGDRVSLHGRQSPAGQRGKRSRKRLRSGPRMWHPG